VTDERVAIGLDSVRIEFDPDVWLRAPADPAQNAAWIAAMVDVHTAAYAVKPGSRDAELLTRLLTEFAERELPGGDTFLRLVGLRESPLVATVSVLAGLPSQVAAQAVRTYNEKMRYYDPPREATVEPERELVRLLRYVCTPDGRLTSIVRHHRRVDPLEADVIVTCEGGDLIVTARALDDLDRLAAAVWLVDTNGARW
jgi:hypothetical protein